MTKLIHRFVKSVPDALEDGVIYVSIEYATAIHKCCCGCGCEVVTPFAPNGWHLLFDGKTVSLEPSIGNWSFKCRSHYWIRHNTVEWVPQWSLDNDRLENEELRSLSSKSGKSKRGTNRF